MATLPTVENFGRRPAPVSPRGVAPVSPGAASAVADAIGSLGNEAARIGFEAIDREATAAAKERDAIVSEQIRTLLYDPQNGYMNLEGGAAVQKRGDILARLDQLKSSAMEGLSVPAQKKLEDALRNRIESAKQSIDVHASVARKAWIDGASAARIESAYQDSLADPANTDLHVSTIVSELRGRAIRDGWDSERLELETRKATSKIYNDQAIRIASTDPVAAMQYLRDNRDRMLPSDVVNLEARLQPAIKEYSGRAKGSVAFHATGDMSGAMALAAQNIGLSEVEQRAALQEYMANGGANLDPAVTAWCAAYVNASLAQAGIAGTGSNLARSFLNWGQEVTTPQRGDLVVLSRGDPDGQQGHVGFFDGFNEDGSVRVLGGNQGNAVSIASYPADRVLGYRRAAPGDVKVQPGVSSLLNIQDPIEQKAALAEYNFLASIRDGQIKAQREAARDAAFRMIEAGGSVTSLPLEQRQALGEEAMSALLAYQTKRNAGDPVETDPATYLMLRKMQANDLAAFRRIDMTAFVDRLSESDWKAFVDAQSKPVDHANLVAASTLMETARRHMSAAGIDLTPEEGSYAARRVAEIETQLLVWQDQYIRDKGEAPPQIEIDRKVARMLTAVNVNDSYLPYGDTGDVTMIDILLMAEEGKLSGDVTIGNATYDGERLTEAIAALRDAGFEITPENIKRIFAELQK